MKLTASGSGFDGSMRFSEYLLWFLVTFASLFFVSAVLPRSWPEQLRTIFRIVVAVAFFFLVGAYWLTTGEKLDESAYRLVLCQMYNFERCKPPSDVAAEEERRRQVEAQRQQSAAEAREREAEKERRRQTELERQKAADEAREREVEAERRRQSEVERQRLAAEAREREAEAERRRQAEAERQRLVAEAREREAEAERRRRAEAERQRLAVEARERETEAERRRQAEAERQRLAAEAREREAEAERRRQIELERLSRRHAATAVGRDEATKRFYATTFFNQSSISEAESQALTRCNQFATDCKVIARFSGAGKCVFVAHGRTISHEPGRIRHRTGVRSAASDWEVLQKCRFDFDECNVFHTRCNS